MLLIIARMMRFGTLFALCLAILVHCGAEKHLWFTAVGNGLETDYLMMIQAAVESGLQCCAETLYPVVMVGGNPAHVPSWLVDLHQSRQVLLLNHNLSFTSRIDHFGKDKSIRQHGAFQRLDIPLLVADIHAQLLEEDILVSKEFAMYTDADVLMYNVNEFFKPHMIAYGAEDEKGQAANSGVLFMNIPNMKKEIDHLFDFADKNLWNFPAIEQGLVLQFFRGKHVQLSDTYNWKPYWGINHNASIVHFHGAKVDRCVECFIKNMYTTDHAAIGACTNPRGMCGAYALWNAVARDRYQLTYKQQMQAYVHYVRDVYRFIYDLSVRLDKIIANTSSVKHKPRRVYTVGPRNPRYETNKPPNPNTTRNVSKSGTEDRTEAERISDIYFKNHPVEE